MLAQFADDESVHEGFWRLHEYISNPVIADQGIGKRQDLAAIRWIGKALLITNHACIEDDLPRRFEVIE